MLPLVPTCWTTANLVLQSQQGINEDAVVLLLACKSKLSMFMGLSCGYDPRTEPDHARDFISGSHLFLSFDFSEKGFCIRWLVVLAKLFRWIRWVRMLCVCVVFLWPGIRPPELTWRDNALRLWWFCLYCAWLYSLQARFLFLLLSTHLFLNSFRVSVCACKHNVCRRKIIKIIKNNITQRGLGLGSLNTGEVVCV